MDRETFRTLLHYEFDRIFELNDTKGPEYAGEEDVLSNFKGVAQAVGITPEQALLTYQTKHWQAINSYAQTGAVLSEPIEGRVRDLILYGLLFLAMVKDKEPKPTTVDVPAETDEPPSAP